jgi:hypothetical protein
VFGTFTDSAIAGVGAALPSVADDESSQVSLSLPQKDSVVNPIFQALQRLGYLPAEADFSDLSNFSTDELAAFRTTLTELFSELNTGEQPDIEMLRPVVEGAEALAASISARGDTEALAAALAARLDAVNARPVRTPVGALAAAVPPGRRPVPRTGIGTVTAALVASSGKPLATSADLAEQVGRAFERIGRGRSQVVAESHWQMPTERQLTEDATLSTARMDAVASMEAITASGGTCLPVNVDYSVDVLGSTARPVRDALPRFGADRGGLRFVSPPTLASAAGGVAIWTESNDVSLSSPATKPILLYTCGTETLVYVDAIPARMKLGNFASRYNPEQVAALLAQLNITQARVAEVNLLQKLNAASIEVTTAKLLGAAEDLLAQLDGAASAYRYRQRLDPTASLRAILPAFAKDMIRADMARRLATDNSAGVGGSLAVSDEQIVAWFTVRHINVTWCMDGLPAQVAGNTYPLQGFATQTTGVLLDWPSQVVWFLFAEGSFVFLDGGRLDLGIVRDNVSNNTNDLGLFSEVFEGVAFRGLESIKCISTVRPSGASAAAVSTAAY